MNILKLLKFARTVKIDEKSGSVEIFGERFIILLGGILQNFYDAMARIAGQGAGAMVYEIGVEAGKKYYDLIKRMYNGPKIKWKNPSPEDMHHLLKFMFENLAILGFGRFEIIDIKKDSLVFRVHNCPISMHSKDVKFPKCYFIGGASAAITKALYGRFWNAREVKCMGMKDPYCEFVITRETNNNKS